MKKIITSLTICAIAVLCCGCESETINALNPVVQTAKMQNSAKQTTDEVKQIREYAEQIQKQRLNELEEH